MAAETDIELRMKLNPKGIKEQTRAIQSEMEDTLNKVDTSKLDDKTRKSLVKMQQLTDKAEQLCQNMQNMEDAFPDQIAENIETARTQMEYYNNQLQTCNSLTEEQKQIFQSLAEEWQGIYQRNVNIADMIQQTGDVEGVLYGTNAEYRTMKENLVNVNNQMSAMVVGTTQMRTNFSQLSTVSKVFRIIGNGLEEIGSRIQRCARDMLRFGATATENGEMVEASMAGIGSVITGITGRIIRSIGQVSLAIESALTTALPIIYNILAILGKVVNVLQRVAKTVGGVLVSAFSKFKDILGSIKTRLFDTNKHTKSLGMTVKQLFGTLLGFASLRVLFNKIRSAVMSSIKSLAQFNDGNNSVNASMTELTNALTQLQNAFASAFAPILSAVTPALVQLINLCSQAVTAIGMLIARLTGASTFIRAKKVQQDYAKALGKTGKAAGSAANELAKFDDLDVLDNKGGGGSGGGAGALDPSEMFEEVPLDGIDWLDDWVDKLKKAWENADFTEIGNIIGAKLRDALNKASDWLVDVAQPWAEKFGKSLATFLNGFLETEGLAAAIGRFFGELINTVTIGLHAFLEAFHFKSLGQFLSEGLMTMFKTIKWDVIGQNFALAFNGLFDIMKGAAEKWEPQTIANSIQTFVENAIRGIKWKENAESFSAFAIQLLETLRLTLKQLPWAEFGKDIATFIGNLDWKGIITSLAGTIYEFVNGLLDFAIAFFEEGHANDTFTQIGEAIKEGFETIEWGPIAEKLVTLFKMAWDALDDIFGPWLEEAWGRVKDYIFENIGRWIIEGLINGIKNSFIIQDPVGWLFTQIYEGLIKKFLIGSPSKVMYEVGSDIAQGIVNGIKTCIEKIKQIWENIKQTAITIWTTIKEKIVTLVTNLKEKVIELWNNVKTKVTEIITTIKDTAIKLWTSIKEKISEIVTDIKTKVSETFTNLKTTVIELFTSLKQKVLEIWNGIWSGIKGVINNILGGIESMCNGIVRGINKVTSALSNIGFDMPSWLGGGSLHINIPQLSGISLPRLAQGAVIPPNKQFLAMLGDQKSGTNIEAPLDLIKEAFADVVANMEVQNTGYSEMKLDGQTFARLMTPYMISELRREGYNVSVLKA